MKITDKNTKEVEKKKLKITHNKGFHITFENGWRVSVQFGVGNYCDNYNNPVEEFREIGKVAYASDTAEIWAWDANGNHYPEDPKGHQSPKEILKFMNKISKKKSASLGSKN